MIKVQGGFCADHAKVIRGLRKMSYSKQFNERAMVKQYDFAVTPSSTVDNEITQKTKTDQERSKITHEQLSKAGDAEEAGLIALNNVNADAKLSSKEKEKKQRAFNRLLERLQEHRLWLLGIMKDIQDDIDKLTIGIEECGRVIDALQDYKDGKITLGDDGYPANDKAKTAIQEWEKKNNKKWDPNTQEGIEAIDTIILSETNERNGLNKQRSDKQTEWNKWNKEWEATDEMINKYSDTQYVSTGETQDLQNWVEQAEKLREQEGLRQQQETLDNDENTTANVSAENNALTAAADIFNSAPGIS